MGLMDGATEEVADDDMVYRPLSVSLRLRLFMNGWSMTCLKLGLSFGFFLNSRWIRSLASFDMAAGNYMHETKFDQVAVLFRPELLSAFRNTL